MIRIVAGYRLVPDAGDLLSPIRKLPGLPEGVAGGPFASSSQWSASLVYPWGRCFDDQKQLASQKKTSGRQLFRASLSVDAPSHDGWRLQKRFRLRDKTLPSRQWSVAFSSSLPATDSQVYRCFERQVNSSSGLLF